MLLTLPLAVAVLGGTAWGTFLSENTALIYGLATAYFVLGLWGGIRLVRKNMANKTDCEDCEVSLEGKNE